MNTLWVCLLTVRDSFHVFASTFIREFIVQFPSVTGEANKLAFCFAAVKLKLRAVYCEVLSPCMKNGLCISFQGWATGTTPAVVWRLFYSLLIKWVLRIISKAANFLVRMKEIYHNYFFTRKSRTNGNLKVLLCRFALEICDRANVVKNNPDAFDKTCFSCEHLQVWEAVKDFSIIFCLLRTVLHFWDWFSI